METRLCTKYANNLEYTLPICRCVVNASPRQIRGGATLNWAFYQPSSSAGGSFSSTSACKESTSHFAARVGLLLEQSGSDLSIYCGPVLLVVLARTVFPILKIKHIGRLILLSFSGTTKKLIFARKPGPQDFECEAPIFYENMNTLPKLELKSPQNRWNKERVTDV